MSHVPPLPRLGQTQIQPPGGRLLTAIPLPRYAPTLSASAAPGVLPAGVSQRCRRRHRLLDRPPARCAPSPFASPAPVLRLARAPQRCRRRRRRRDLDRPLVRCAPSPLASPAPVLVLARAPQRCRRHRRHRDLDRRLARYAPSPLASPARELLLVGDPQRCRRHHCHRMARCAPTGPTSRPRCPLLWGPPQRGLHRLQLPTASHAPRTGSRSRKARGGHKSAARAQAASATPAAALPPPPTSAALPGMPPSQGCSPGLRRRSPASLAGMRR